MPRAPHEKAAIACLRGFEGFRETEIDGLSIRLERVVHWSESGQQDGRLFPYRVVSGDVEQRRQARIATALDKKLPKLIACHSDGDETVLILEYADLALTNQVLVAQALDAALAEQSLWPDYIFLADTTIEESWHLFEPVRHGVFDLAMPRIDVPPDLQQRSVRHRL